MHRSRVRNFIILYMLWSDIFWVKTWIFLTNPKDNLKARCHSKMILGHTIFKLLSVSIFSLKLPLLWNNSISWQWLLFHLIKASRKYKQVIKPDYDFIKIYTKRLPCRLHLNSLFEKVTSHSYDYKTSLQFFAQVSTTLSDGQESSRTCSLLNNNHKTFLALTLLFNQRQGNSVMI